MTTSQGDISNQLHCKAPPSTHPQADSDPAVPGINALLTGSGEMLRPQGRRLGGQEIGRLHPTTTTQGSQHSSCSLTSVEYFIFQCFNNLHGYAGVSPISAPPRASGRLQFMGLWVLWRENYQRAVVVIGNSDWGQRNKGHWKRSCERERCQYLPAPTGSFLLIAGEELLSLRDPALFPTAATSRGHQEASIQEHFGTPSLGLGIRAFCCTPESDELVLSQSWTPVLFLT